MYALLKLLVVMLKSNDYEVPWEVQANKSNYHQHKSSKGEKWMNWKAKET